MLEVFPHMDRYWIEAYARIIKRGKPVRFERRDRESGRWYRTYAYSPETQKVASLIIDITDRVEAETALHNLTETLENQVTERTKLAETRSRQLHALAVQLIEAEERERSTFAHLLHDDLQQMLAAVKMQVQEVAARLPSEKLLSSATQLLEQSITKSRRLSHMLSPAILHQAGLLAALRWLAGQMKEQFGLQVELTAHTEPVLKSSPLTIFLFRAVQELLFNVVKHSGLKACHLDFNSSDTSVEISVSDRGQGFDLKEALGSDHGVGLGLLAIRERAVHIGGRLDIQSAPGRGSRFTIRIPIDSTAEIPLAMQAEQELLEPQKAEPAEAGAARILFVDDHKVMRQGLIRLIENRPGIQVVGEAANGKEALDFARKLRPDVIIMDVSMPVMDGIEATRRIKAEFSDMHVIGLSMHDDEHISRSMQEAGAEAFVTKTASTAELLKVIYGSIHQNH